MNPIYVEYYSHVGDLCYKIDLPWSRYNKDTLVLCPVSEGYDKAKRMAHEAITQHLTAVALEDPLTFLVLDPEEAHR